MRAAAPALRAAVVAVGAACAIVALGFARREPWATALWPWPDGRLTFWFVAAVVAPIAAVVFWFGATGLWRAAAPGALGVTLGAGGMAAYLSQGMPVPGMNHATGLALLAACNAALFIAAQRAAPPAGPPMPALVRWSLAVFALMAIAAGAALLAGGPRVMPWPLQRGSAILLGWIFIGNALAFALPLLQRRPPWLMAAPPLLGLLVHGLVLAVPLALHTAAVRPEHRLSLFAYLIVLAAGAALAVWALFIHAPTRRAWLMQPGPGGAWG
jgi:hypothetical protein